jgi:hypothetical protein
LKVPDDTWCDIFVNKISCCFCQSTSKKKFTFSFWKVVLLFLQKMRKWKKTSPNWPWRLSLKFLDKFEMLLHVKVAVKMLNKSLIIWWSSQAKADKPSRKVIGIILSNLRLLPIRVTDLISLKLVTKFKKLLKLMSGWYEIKKSKHSWFIFLN